MEKLVVQQCILVQENARDVCKDSESVINTASGSYLEIQRHTRIMQLWQDFEDRLAFALTIVRLYGEVYYEQAVRGKKLQQVIMECYESGFGIWDELCNSGVPPDHQQGVQKVKERLDRATDMLENAAKMAKHLWQDSEEEEQHQVEGSRTDSCVLFKPIPVSYEDYGRASSLYEWNLSVEWLAGYIEEDDLELERMTMPFERITTSKSRLFPSKVQEYPELDFR